MPVNLRQFFPSTSPRNFFATIRVEHTYGEGADDLGSVCRQLESQFRPKATPEALEKKLRKFIRFERMPVLRIVPRPLKDVILKLVNWSSNRGLEHRGLESGPGEPARAGRFTRGANAVPRLRSPPATLRDLPRWSAHDQLHLAVHRDRPHQGIRSAADRQRHRGDGRRGASDGGRTRGGGTMRRCTECAVDIEGSWTRCPLCTAPVAGEAIASPLPARAPQSSPDGEC